MVHLKEISSSSSTSWAYQYDVFLSFRGLDTRLGFTNHLYEALVDANLTTFLDDEEIATGEQLKPKLKSAIKSSRASIVVLSTNYASSTWCLDELVLILEQQRSFNQIVIPIFYHVEPTHVRKQQSSFGDAIAQHKQRMEEEITAEKRNQWAQKIELWKTALTQVAHLKGRDAKGRKETELIEEVVSDIHLRLGVPLSNTLPLLIGRNYDIDSIASWLTNGSCHTVDILTLVGMGGIGKTSLVKYIFQLHSKQFPKSSFIEGISGRCNEGYNGLLKLQKQLHTDISNKIMLQVNDVSIYTSKIENALARERVFIVLDDVDSLDQLDSLLGTKGLHRGSKVIVTTKNASLTERCALFKSQTDPNHKEFLLKGLRGTDSLELLCTHAFKNKRPKESYKEVTKDFVKHCDGHPLALEFFGKSLHKRDVIYWKECIKELKKEPHSCIRKAIEMSIDSLPSEDVKELFKYIACFFVGIDRDVTKTILNACDINTTFGITNLIDRCLLHITLNNELMMHQLVQHMGRYLVHQESPNKPWKRSRLWCHMESFDVLKQKTKSMENVLGLALDMRMLEKEKLSGSLQLTTEALSKMDNLKLLQLNYVVMNGSFRNISKELRWLCMHGSCFKSIPSEIPMDNLVCLDMSHSNIESFDMSYSSSQRFVSNLKRLIGSRSKDKPLLGSLKILDLSFCKQLHSLGGFFELPSLEKLIISYCTSLILVSESIEHCAELVLIDLINCKKLKRLPRTIGKLKKLKTLLLSGCDILDFPTEMKEMDSIQRIEAENISMNSQTFFSSVVEVKQRDLRSFVSCLPMSLVKLSLGYNNLSDNSFPMDFSSLSMLKELYLDGNPVVSMPSCVRTLPRLQTLSMQRCQMLKTIELPPHTLTKLRLGYADMLLEVKLHPKKSQPCVYRTEMYHSIVFLIEGVIRIEPMSYAADLVLSLGWTNSKFHPFQLPILGYEMYYEFGIFSTFDESQAEDVHMPNFISCRSTGCSISVAIPSSPNKLRGLNVSFVLKRLSYSVRVSGFPMIIVSNLTKNHTWIYLHYDWDRDDVTSMVFLSHWMFSKNEMEDGDQVTVSITNGVYGIKECGVGFVFDSGRMKEDVLGYYKSWNHIIGGDLSGFQTTTGEYILWNKLFFDRRVDIYQYVHPFISESDFCNGEMVRFRAFSQQKSNLVPHRREPRGAREAIQFRHVTRKMTKSLRTKVDILDFIYNMFKCSEVKTRSHLCFSLKLYTLSRLLHDILRMFHWFFFLAIRIKSS